MVNLQTFDSISFIKIAQYGQSLTFAPLVGGFSCCGFEFRGAIGPLDTQYGG